MYKRLVNVLRNYEINPENSWYVPGSSLYFVPEDCVNPSGTGIAPGCEANISVPNLSDKKLNRDKSLSKAKVLEEINELIEAVEEDSNKIHEAADVFYHLIMYLEANNIKIEDVMIELEKRKKWAINFINLQDQDYKEVN